MEEGGSASAGGLEGDGQGAPELEFCPAEVGSCRTAAVGLVKGAVTCNWGDARDK